MIDFAVFVDSIVFLPGCREDLLSPWAFGHFVQRLARDKESTFQNHYTAAGEKHGRQHPENLTTRSWRRLHRSSKGNDQTNVQLVGSLSAAVLMRSANDVMM